jgi:threonine aldolase
LAKGRLAGVQFDALFTNGLYFQISQHAITMARRMRELLQARHYPFYIDSPTNQQFVILPNDEVARLEHQVQFTHWGPYDEDHTICRFVTSWATTDEDLQTLRKILED